MEIRKDPGRIITFYSYKGGTGRSMALANVAWLLATAGKRVLMLDWDLEAPGLHRYVHPFLDDPDLDSCEGIIDFVIAYAEEASGKKLDERLDPNWFAPYANITRFATPLDYTFPGGGMLDFIPAGKQGSAYAGRVNSFNWRDFYVHLGGRAVLEEARNRMREHYDFILIDSRTGVSDTSGICTVQLPDDVVICFTLNMQSVGGAAAAARSMQEQRPANPLNLFPVAMRVESGEKIKTELIREYAKRKFLPLMSDSAVEPAARDRYWHDVETPQIEFYAFEEQMAYFLDSPNDTKGVLGAMKLLVWHLTKVDVRNDPGPDPEIRKSILEAYSGVWSAAAPQTAADVVRRFVYVSYGPSSTGARVPLHGVPTGPDVITAADLPRTGPWLDAFRGILRRCSGMVVAIDRGGLSHAQQRELVVALDYRFRIANSADFRIAAVQLPGAEARPIPGLPSPDLETCPYPGLRPFETEAAGVYFGQESFLDKLAEQIHSAPLVFLGGKPGTGKTSALKAGLIPRLFLQESPRPVWKAAFCDLSDDPMAGITEALVRARGTAQFEEQVRQETSEVTSKLAQQGAGVFKDLVASVLSAWPPAQRIAVIVEAGASRFDPRYLRAMLQEAPAVSLILVVETAGPEQISLPPFSTADLIRAIEQPALRAGAVVEPGLAARIAADLDGREDALALLQFCMPRLWERRVEGVIRSADYDALGRAEGAVAAWADSSLETLAPGERESALRLMSRMIGIAEDGAHRLRRLGSEYIPEPLGDTLVRLENAKLVAKLVTGDTASYSLFPLALRWPRLIAAVVDDAGFLRWRESFQAAVEHFSARSSYSLLLRDDALAAAQNWVAKRPDEFTAREIDFIRRSEADARIAPAAPPRRSMPLLAIALVIALLLTIAAYVIYFRH